MNASESYDSLLALTRRLLESFTAPALAPFLADWPVAEDARATPGHRSAPRSANAASAPPVIRWLPHIAADVHSFGAPLVTALCRAAPLLAWHQTYTSRELDRSFLQNYAFTEILGPRGARGGERLACGMLLLGPNTLYPPHRHEAEEVYVPLSGTADWQQGDALWRPHAPGALIHHHSEEPHAMRTDENPLLALYLWRGAGLSQHARLERRSAG